jgi:hypothetical protein
MKKWRKLLNDNIPVKWKYYSKYVALCNESDGSDFDGFDFDIKDLPVYYTNQKYLKVWILKPGQIIDTIVININFN